MGNYIYSIGKIWRHFDSLNEARAFMRNVIKNDTNTKFLNRDNNARYYIVREDIRNQYNKRIIHL